MSLALSWQPLDSHLTSNFIKVKNIWVELLENCVKNLLIEYPSQKRKLINWIFDGGFEESCQSNGKWIPYRRLKWRK